MKIEERTVSSIMGHKPVKFLEGSTFRIKTKSGMQFEISDGVSPGSGIEGLYVRTIEDGFSVHPLAFNSAVIVADRRDKCRRSPKSSHRPG